MNSDNYIINNSYISSTHEKTNFCAGDNLISINRAVYHIPVHIIATVFLALWRDEATSTLDTIARRITCGLALGALAFVGIVDTVIRLAFAFFSALIGSFETYSIFLRMSMIGLQHSFYSLTILQANNIFDDKILTHSFWVK
jgi:hypothetical protein